MKNIKTEETKLREEIEQIESTPNKHIEPCHECENLPLLKAKLQQLLTDKKLFKDTVEKLIFAMQQSRDCFGYNPHKVFTTNLCYNYAIEGEEITASAKKLLDFAMGCYKNGWLEAINQFEKLKKELEEN